MPRRMLKRYVGFSLRPYSVLGIAWRQHSLIVFQRLLEQFFQFSGRLSRNLEFDK
jgi:hypothetical protein